MATRRECSRCGSLVEVETERLVVTSAIDDDENSENSRVYCPYYQRSETTTKAFHVLFRMDDCFKDSYSCCYCSHRIIEPEGGHYCPYKYYDPEARNLYYIAPSPDGSSSVQETKTRIRYWSCPVCGSNFELSRRETSLRYRA